MKSKNVHIEERIIRELLLHKNFTDCVGLYAYLCFKASNGNRIKVYKKTIKDETGLSIPRIIGALVAIKRAGLVEEIPNEDDAGNITSCSIEIK